MDNNPTTRRNIETIKSDIFTWARRIFTEESLHCDNPSDEIFPILKQHISFSEAMRFNDLLRDYHHHNMLAGKSHNEFFDQYWIDEYALPGSLELKLLSDTDLRDQSSGYFSYKEYSRAGVLMVSTELEISLGEIETIIWRCEIMETELITHFSDEYTLSDIIAL